MKRPTFGQSLVEMALVAPVLILVIMGLIESGYYIHTRSAIENAAQRGAEWAYLSPPTTITSGDDDSSDKCAKLIKETTLVGIVLQTLTAQNITLSFPDPAHQMRELGTPIQLQISYTGEWLTPLGRQIFGDEMKFNVVSRRTIVNTSPPVGMAENCTPLPS